MLKGGRDYYWKYARPGGLPLDYGSAIEYATTVCAWEKETNRDFFNWWLYVNYEYAADDISMSELFDQYVSGRQAYLMTDQRGFDWIAEEFVENNELDDYIKYNQRVSHIKYNISNDPNDIRAEVTTQNCLYRCKRVVLAVPSGTLNNDLITFEPALTYKDEDHNPFLVSDYVKIFYEFKENFGARTRSFSSHYRRKTTKAGATTGRI